MSSQNHAWKISESTLHGKVRLKLAYHWIQCLKERAGGGMVNEHTSTG